MKKLIFLIPLLIFLMIILSVACNIIKKDLSEEKSNNTEQTAQAENDLPESPMDVEGNSLKNSKEAEYETAPSIDMRDFTAKNGLPKPKGSINDTAMQQSLEFTKEDDGSFAQFDVKSISFLAVGDNLIHSSIYADAKEQGKENGYAFYPMYENVAAKIKEADLSFINQESPIAGDEFEPSGYPMFSTPKEMGQTLIDLGFDIISIANNHMLDKREKGLENNINYWKDKPVTLIGGYTDEEDFNNIRVVEKDGISIAMLAYTYGTNGMSLPSGSKMIVPYIDNDIIVRQIGLAKKKGDLVFVSVHWGAENTFTPNSSQTELAQLMADNGVDVILGHHSHTLQPIKWLDRPDGRKTLVIYSLSNFMSGMEYPKNMLAGMLTFDIEKIDNSATNISNVKFIPTLTHYNSAWRGFKLYYLDEYNQSLYSGARCSKFEPKYEYYIRTVKSVISPEFLPDYLK